MRRAFDFLGVRCHVDLDDAIIAGWLDSLFWRFVSDVDDSADASHLTVKTEKSGFHVQVDGQGMYAGLGREEAAMRLIVELNRATVRWLEGFAIHGGALWGASGAVLLPGPPGSGKSTLTAACARSGLPYMSDEIALFTGDGSVRPFPKPLWLSSWSRHILGIDDDSLQFVAPGFKAVLAPEELGVNVVVDPVDVGHIILIRRSESGTSLEEVNPSHGAAELMSNTYHLDERSAIAFPLAAEVVREATVLELKVDDPPDAAETVAKALG